MTSPWMTTEEAAIYLRFVDAHGKPRLTETREFLMRQRGLRTTRRGRVRLFRREDVEQALPVEVRP